MRDHRYYTCDVFTDRMFSGNPLAVLTDARGLDDQAMQSIAHEFNFSATTFVTPPADKRHTARASGELPFAGHPTVGTAFVLASKPTSAMVRFRLCASAGFGNGQRRNAAAIAQRDRSSRSRS